MNPEKEFHFDGFGINDQTGERIATMAGKKYVYDDKSNRLVDNVPFFQNANILAAAPEMLALLEEMYYSERFDHKFEKQLNAVLIAANKVNWVP